MRIAGKNLFGTELARCAPLIALALLLAFSFAPSAAASAPQATVAQHATLNLTTFHVPLCGGGTTTTGCNTFGVCPSSNQACELVNGCYRCVITSSTSTSTTTVTSTSSTSTSTTSTSTTETTTIAGTQACLVSAPDGYCGYGACPSGQSCVSGSHSLRVLQNRNNQCTISVSGGYDIGTCQPTQNNNNNNAPPAPGTCGYLPPNLAKIITTDENWYCPINNYTYGVWSKYLPLAMVVLLLAFIIAALLIMVGIATRNDSIRNFGMGEFLEASASAIIVIVFLYVSAVMFGLFPGSLVGPINPYATALHLVNSTISATQGIYGNLYATYSVAAFYSSMETKFSLAGYAINPNFAGIIKFLFLEPTSVLISMLTDAVAMLYAEYFLIIFFAMASIPAFLVPGVIFRALLPTRALGGMLIAMAMGFYIVMPTLFALAYYFTAPQLGQQLNTMSVELNQFGSGTGSQTNALNPTSPLVTTLASVQDAMGEYWLLILFYPTLIVAVTYAFITQVASIIGGSSYIGSRVRGFI